jgi:hypothetical protein
MAQADLGDNLTDIAILAAVAFGAYWLYQKMSADQNSSMGGQDFGTPASGANDSSWGS